MHDMYRRVNDKNTSEAYFFEPFGCLTRLCFVCILCGMKLSEYLQKNNLTQSEFAAQLGVSQPHISRLLSGVSGVPLRVLDRIRDLTNGDVTPNDFLPLRPSPSTFLQRSKAAE
jgi:DNA-binding transcriptional regulator YdaS (Cro superfamily)